MKRFLHPAVAAALAALLLTAAAHAQSFGPKPSLFLLTVGVSHHQQAANDTGVKYAAKDARDVAELFRAQQGKLFSTVDYQTLTDSKATRRNIEEALAAIAKKATANDYVLVYLAGHGGPDSLGNYLYVSYDSHHLLPSTNVSGTSLRKVLARMSGKRFLVLDTCHAAAAGSGMEDFSKGSGFVTFAACLPSENSAENPLLENGYFTRAFIEGLEGKADANKDGIVTLAELDAYVADRVQILTRGRQQTTMVRPASIQSRLPLAMVTGSVGVPAASANPPPITTGPVSTGQAPSVMAPAGLPSLTTPPLQISTPPALISGPQTTGPMPGLIR